MLNFGAFQQGYNENEKILAARRKENAALYSDFVRANPGASADDREKFAESLAGRNKSFRAVLPSRSMMEANVAAYNKEKERVEAERARKLQLQQIDIVNKASDFMADVLQTSSDTDALSAVKSTFGTLLPDNLIGAVQSQAERKGWAEFQRSAAPLVDNFLNTPNDSNFKSLNREGYSPRWNKMLMDQHQGKLDTAKDQAKAAYVATMSELATTSDLDDNTVFDAKSEAAQSKVRGLLDQETIDKATANAIEIRKQARIQRSETAVSDFNKISQQVAQNVRDGVDGYQSMGAIKQRVNELFSANENFKYIPKQNGIDMQTTFIKELEKELEDTRTDTLRALDVAEQAAEKQQLQELISNRDLDYNGALETVKEIVKGSIGLDPELDKNATAQRNVDVDATTNQIVGLISQLGNYGLNLGNGDLVAGLANQILEEQAQLQGAMEGEVVPFSIEMALEAYDQLLQSGNGLAPLELRAVNMALTELGMSGVADLSKLPDLDLSGEISAAFGEIAEAQNDLYDPTEVSISNVTDNVNNEISEIEGEISQLNINDTLTAVSELLDVDIADRDIDALNEWATEGQKNARSLVIASTEIELKANRLEKLATDPFYVKGNRELANQALARATKLKELSQAYQNQANAIAEKGMEIRKATTVAPATIPIEEADKSTALVQGVNTIAASVAANAQNMSEEQIFQMVVDQVRKAAHLAPTKTYTGGIAERESTGFIDSVGQTLAAPFRSLIGGGESNNDVYLGADEGQLPYTGPISRFMAGEETQVPDLLPMIEMIYEQLAEKYNLAPMPTEEMGRQYLGMDQGMLNLNFGLGDRYNYATGNQ
tara:strand:+ start:7351 stop:9849 length:2499 start_codon:yes stop_codon:yes gene_type:complete